MTENIEAIVSQMTLEEKAALCTGATTWTTTPVERLGVPQMYVSDGPHGVRRETRPETINSPSLPATCFPTASCLASSWDTDLMYVLGQALGKECLALKVDVLLGPGVNMKRTPLCGRNFEYFSEDPFLAGELATSYVQGVQRQGVGTSLKHYAANNQETDRSRINTIVDERTLREIYLPAFEAVVKEAKPWTVMCAYNRLNGTYCSEHYDLLVNILKEEWGFEGPVVSDWGAVHNRVEALKGGLDLEMPGPKPRRVQAVIEAVKNGELDESQVDEAARRILRIVFKAAETPKGGIELDIAGHHALARRIAGEGMVLLKNDGLLPLKGVKSIAMIGRSAKEPYYQGGGSSHMNPTQLDIPLVELQKLSGGAKLTYHEGYPAHEEFQQALIDEAVQAAKAAEVAVIFIALPPYKESEGYDRPDMDLTVQQVALIQAVSAVQPRTVVVLNNGSAVTMTPWLDKTAAVLEAWMMGQAGGGAIADILFGVVNPSGKLAESFPYRLADTPAYINFPGGNGEVRYGEGLFIGYRYYDTRQMPVMFPFGFGLSYTSFAYSNAKVSSSFFKDVDGLTVSVDVSNTGKIPGKEIVQVYVHDLKSKLARPPKELKGFAKIALQPGETKTVTIQLDRRAFAYYHPGYGEWFTEEGEFDILIGASASDIRCSETVTMQSTQELPSLLNRESTVGEWLEDPRGKKVLEPLLPKVLEQMAASFEGSSGEAIPEGMDISAFLMDMSLEDFVAFPGKASTTPPDVIVDQLLKQVYKGSDG